MPASAQVTRRQPRVSRSSREPVAGSKSCAQEISSDGVLHRHPIAERLQVDRAQRQCGVIGNAPGGRGMRIARNNEELPNLFHAAYGEAANAFGNGELYMEKFVENPRHIEFQVLADEHGNVTTLFERECSIQRRHQKLIEEAPSLQVTPKLREELSRTVCRCLADIGYQNAGTVEFLMDADRQLYFIEMNTRIQVEHPITEAITGVDIVKAQLRISSGDRLPEILP